MVRLGQRWDLAEYVGASALLLPRLVAHDWEYQTATAALTTSLDGIESSYRQTPEERSRAREEHRRITNLPAERAARNTEARGAAPATRPTRTRDAPAAIYFYEIIPEDDIPMVARYRINGAFIKACSRLGIQSA